MDKFHVTVMALAGLAIFVLVFPEAKTAYDSFVTAMLAVTGITGGVSYMILTSMPYFIIATVIAKALWSLFHKKRMG